MTAKQGSSASPPHRNNAVPNDLDSRKAAKFAKKTQNAGRELHSLNSERNLGTKPAFQALPLRLSVLCVRFVLHRSGGGEELEKVRPHPNPMASQARHQSVSREGTSASRYVVPQERVKHRSLVGRFGAPVPSAREREKRQRTGAVQDADARTIRQAVRVEVGRENMVINADATKISLLTGFGLERNEDI